MYTVRKVRINCQIMLFVVYLLSVFSCNCGDGGFERFSIGVCYYPEQYYSTSLWKEDLIEMNNLGIKYVRIGEFMWSTFERKEGEYDWTVLDTVFDYAEQYTDLKFVLGTPTATPPNWLINRFGGSTDASTILPVSKEGVLRTFGSRRHYTFSSDDYLRESEKIVEMMAKRYGNRKALLGYQIDNELGCHSTTRSYSKMDMHKFQIYLSEKYGTVDTLNDKYGNAFWGMDYASFTDINLPNLCVTEANPSIWLDFYRFSSDNAINYLDNQVNVLRRYSKPEAIITTNNMGYFDEIDYFKLSENLDFTSWDCYPLGDLNTNSIYTSDMLSSYYSTGHPDYIGFNDDLTYTLKKSAFWIMENQPGPVNWAPQNPAPPNHMLRTWTYQHFSHHAEVVSFFRWRRSQHAQEQMHHGVLNVDHSKDDLYFEIEKVAKEVDPQTTNLGKVLQGLRDVKSAEIGLLFDFESRWSSQIEPQGSNYDYIRLVFHFYTSLRQLGVNVNICSSETCFSEKDFKIVVIPSLEILSIDVVSKISEFAGLVLFGPRSGSKDEHFMVPDTLPPGSLQKLIPMKVTKVESLEAEYYKNNQVMFLKKGNKTYSFDYWREWVVLVEEEGVTEVRCVFEDNKAPALVRNGNVEYMAFFPSIEFLKDYLWDLMMEYKLDDPPVRLEEGLRIQRWDDLVFAVNYNDVKKDISDLIPKGSEVLLGNNSTIGPFDVTIWKE